MTAPYTIKGIELPSPSRLCEMFHDKSGHLTTWAANQACEWIRANCTFDKEFEFYTVTEAELIEAKNNFRKMSEQALDIGSRVHDLISIHIQQGPEKARASIWHDPSLTDLMRKQADNAFSAFLEWEADKIDYWFASEMTVVSWKHMYAGTLDGAARFKDGLNYIVDYKSSKGIYAGYQKQVAAYRQAYEEMTESVKGWGKIGHKIDGCGILRLDKELGLPFWKDTSKNYERKRISFNLMLDLFYNDAKRRLKNNPRVK